MSDTKYEHEGKKNAFNVKLAEDVLRSIFTVPENHLQDQWFEVAYFSEVPTVGSTIQKYEDGSSSETRTVTVNTMLEGSCGTTACIAGWATLHAGWKFNTTLEVSRDGWGGLSWGGLSYEVVSPEGESETFSSTPDLEIEGARALGLTFDQAQDLFYTMDEKEAAIRLYSLIKGWPTDIFNVAAILSIDIKDEFGGVDEEELVVKIYNEIQQEYPPFTSSELRSFLSKDEMASSA